jgi:hypothetical protein
MSNAATIFLALMLCATPTLGSEEAPPPHRGKRTSLHLDQFEEADRYAIDLYGAVQDGFMQRHDATQAELKK